MAVAVGAEPPRERRATEGRVGVLFVSLLEVAEPEQGILGVAIAHLTCVSLLCRFVALAAGRRTC